MFRIFLRRKVHSGPKTEPSQTPLRQTKQRNRRLYERYNVNQQHLTVLNDQDILVIRDVSTRGFCSDVSPRAFNRFNIGDVYEGRMRYLGTLYDLKFKVSWKKNKAVGFELYEPSNESIQFFKRVVKPIQLAGSLQKVDAEFLTHNLDGKIWYHGDSETDLYIWTSDNKDLKAWQLRTGNNVVEWNSESGFSTGVVERSPTDDSESGSNLETKSDPELNKEKLQFASDVLMALQTEFRNEIINTLTG